MILKGVSLLDFYQCVKMAADQKRRMRQRVIWNRPWTLQKSKKTACHYPYQNSSGASPLQDAQEFPAARKILAIVWIHRITFQTYLQFEKVLQLWQLCTLITSTTYGTNLAMLLPPHHLPCRHSPFPVPHFRYYHQTILSTFQEMCATDKQMGPKGLESTKGTRLHIQTALIPSPHNGTSLRHLQRLD
ncbi:hypothetical protein BSKO_01904 [Bryopsis sp. KO-2023]|nr:hypothetical protein BSKO_01904 [Bryopsis sp. KO-2023]